MDIETMGGGVVMYSIDQYCMIIVLHAQCVVYASCVVSVL